MRVVICSDVHGNVAALEAVLADIRREGWPDVFFVAGDLALSGPRPAEVLALLRSIDGARFVVGNCDEYIANRDPEPEVRFAVERLSDDDLAFLGGLPLTQSLDADHGRSLLVCHANPRNVMDPIKPELSEAVIRPLLEGVTAELIAFGHYHVPFVRRIADWMLADIASVGMPRDGDLRAVYAVLTPGEQGWKVEHRRVEYDWNSVARDFSDVGFPGAEQAAANFLRARY